MSPSPRRQGRRWLVFSLLLPVLPLLLEWRGGLQGFSSAPERTDLYKVLGVRRSATNDEIKRAFRALALKYHPDVATEDGAAQRFVEIADAYEVLSDARARSTYDRAGFEGLRHGDAQPQQGAADLFWQEFRPAKRAGPSRKFQARDAAARGVHDPISAMAAVAVGAVVEYPLRSHDVADGRTHGIGLVVGRNAERGDAERLPAERRSLCEIEPLWQPEDEMCSPDGCWLADDLEGSAFAHEQELRVLRSEYVRGRGLGMPEHWLVHDTLSKGAASPDGSSGFMV